MLEKELPQRDDLPTSAQLLRSTLLAVIVAAVLLVTVVLPAEYAIDPTGVGRLIGLTQMGEIKQGEPASTEVAASLPPAAPAAGAREDRIALVLEAGKGTEVKVEMVKGSTLNYAWRIEGGTATFDMHGEPFTDLKTFTSYKTGDGASSDEGVLEAPFDGRHGFYWKNTGDAPITIRLEVKGKYQNFRQIGKARVLP